MVILLSVPAEGHAAPGHPERPDRIGAALAGMASLHLGDDLEVVEPAPAPEAALRRIHDERYLERLKAAVKDGSGTLDPDTYLTSSSWQDALVSAGAGLRAVERLAERGEGVGVVLTRPPGHHATRAAGMGFCLLNNVALAAAELAGAGERVLVVDWDVHHGNGTQDIFWDDERVLYASLHQFGIYPGSGESHEVGGDGAVGLTVNVPLPARATGDVARAALEEVVAPTAVAFSPTWVLVSAGFDAHRADPLADLALSAGDFGDLAATVAQFAPAPRRLVLFLEGGYHLGALRDSVAATVGRLLGVGQPEEGEAPTSGGPGRDWVAHAGATRRRLTY